MPELPDFLVGWVILAAAGLASWFAIRTAYQRGFSDGLAEGIRELRRAWLQAGRRPFNIDEWPFSADTSADYWVIDTQTKKRLRRITVEAHGIVPLAENEDLIRA